MTDILPWSFLFTLPGLFIGSLALVKRPGIVSIFGPSALLAASVAWLLGAGRPSTVVLQGWLPFMPNAAFMLRIDSLAAMMLAILGIISLCVYVYSLGYLADDPGIRRFFAFLDLFVGAMALLVTAGNLTVLLIGWTGVGMSSYFLISFWREKPGTLNAGLQAIAANAVGDAALILAAVLVPSGCGDLLTLQTSACTAGIGGAPLLAALLVIAASAKSAQGPLYFWLPSAMAGPTPISALIHAATMVAAGVYLLVRTYAVLALSPAVLAAVAALGVVTALFGALASLRQSNLKKGLAYSTVSQLGYMFAGIGFGVPFASFFHLGSQAFFKALLFLAAGVVIHALNGQEELSAMGGLANALPSVRWAFLIGSVSLFGFPFTSGAFSKDAILEGGAESFPFLGWLLVLCVLLSGLYIGRLFFATFYRASTPPGHLHSSSATMFWPLLPLAIGALFFGYAQWPGGGISHLLQPVLGQVAVERPASVQGLIAASLGIIGFLTAGWWQATKVAPTKAMPSLSWVDWTASRSLSAAAWVAGIQNGRLGRYVLATLFGFAVILFAGLRR